MAEPSEPRRRRVMTEPRHKWSEEEEREILLYAKELMQEGKDFEKPSATEYYKKFQRATGNKVLADMALDKLVQHMKVMKKAYVAALQFMKNTGEGILETTPEAVQTVEAKIRQICRYYEEFSELLGQKPQFNPPFVMGTDATETHIIVLDESGFDEMTDCDALAPTTSTSASYIKRPIENKGDKASAETPPEKRKRQSPVKHSSKALETAIRLKCAADESRLEWEKACKIEEKEAIAKAAEEATNLEINRFEFEKTKWEAEMELRRADKEQNVRQEEAAARNAEHQKQLESQQLDFLKIKWEAEMELQKKAQDDRFRIEELKIKADLEFRKFELQQKLEMENRKK